MKTFSMTEFKAMTRAEIEAAVPFQMTFDGTPAATVMNPKDIIFIGDMHPRVQIQFRNKETIIRRGMPK